MRAAARATTRVRRGARPCRAATRRSWRRPAAGAVSRPWRCPLRRARAATAREARSSAAAPDKLGKVLSTTPCAHEEGVVQLHRRPRQERNAELLVGALGAVPVTTCTDDASLRRKAQLERGTYHLDEPWSRTDSTRVWTGRASGTSSSTSSFQTGAPSKRGGGGGDRGGDTGGDEGTMGRCEEIGGGGGGGCGGGGGGAGAPSCRVSAGFGCPVDALSTAPSRPASSIAAPSTSTRCTDT